MRHATGGSPLSLWPRLSGASLGALSRTASSVVLPVSLVTGCLLGSWLIFDVSLQDALLFVGYELGFVVLPGLLCYMALSGRVALGLEQLAIGWALGYALELGAYLSTAASGHRSLFVLYPPVVALVTLPFVVFHARRGNVDAITTRVPRWAWALALVQIIVIAYFAEQSFTATPPPQTVPAVSYYQDQVWNLSLAAEARHHWPLQLPNLSGLPLHYHYFLFLHMAAVNQVTGVPLFDAEFRLCLPVLALLVALQLVYAGRVLARSTSGGLVAAVLFFLVSGLDPFPGVPGDLFPLLYLSGTFAYGMVFFLPAITELVRAFRARSSWRGARGRWAVIVLLLAAASGSKGTILPVVVGGVALLAGYAFFRARELLPRLATFGAIGIALFLVTGALVFGSRGGGLSFRPFQIIAQEQPFDYFRNLVPSPSLHDPASWPVVLAVIVLGPLAVLLGVLKLVATLLPGFVGAWISRRERDTVSQLWPAALFAAAIALFLAFVAYGQSQGYFYVYGFAAGCVLSGAGLVVLWRKYVRPIGLKPVVGWALVGLVALIWLVDRPLEGTPKKFWLWASGSHPGVGCRPTLALDELYSTCNANLTPALYEGLRWLKGHSDPNDVLAVSNLYQDPGKTDGRYFYYSAFAERRVMLEGWYNLSYSPLPYPPLEQARRAPDTFPYPHRFRLDEGIFQRADPRAVQTAEREFGVRYLVADKVHGITPAQASRIATLGHVVFDNEAVEIVEVGPPRPSQAQ